MITNVNAGLVAVNADELGKVLEHVINEAIKNDLSQTLFSGSKEEISTAYKDFSLSLRTKEGEEWKITDGHPDITGHHAYNIELFLARGIVVQRITRVFQTSAVSLLTNPTHCGAFVTRCANYANENDSCDLLFSGDPENIKNSIEKVKEVLSGINHITKWGSYSLEESNFIGTEEQVFLSLKFKQKLF